MDDLRETVNAALRTFHNLSNYPTLFDSDLQIGRELVFAAIEASGHCVVPVEPTPKMVAAGDVYPIVGGSPDDVYRAMLTAYGQGDKPSSTVRVGSDGGA